MSLSEGLQKLLNKKYTPASMINLTFKGKDLAFKTDASGNPILLFIGKLNEKNGITGERYARTLKFNQEGEVIKDHWELKGKAT